MLKSTSKILLSTGSLAISIPFSITDDRKEKSREGRFIKPSKLPIYESKEDLYNFEYHGKEKSQFREGVTVVRKEVGSIIDATQEVRDSINNFVETGKAHSLGGFQYIRDEDNFSAKVGLISVGVLSGLLLGIRKGFFRKLIYCSIGAGSAASICYPGKAVEHSKDLVINASEYATIAYNFVAGVKPKEYLTDLKSFTDAKPKQDLNKTVPPPAKVPEEDLKTTVPDPTEASNVKSSEPAEVRPTSKPSFETILQNSSDIALWGFRLKDSPEESYYSISNDDEPSLVSDDDGEIKEQKTLGFIKEISVHSVMLLAANVVSGIAGQVAEIASKISDTAESIETTSDRIESLAEIVETIAEKSGELPGIPHSVKKVAAAVDFAAECVDDITEGVESVTSGVTDFAEAAKRIAKNIESKADDFIDDKEDDIKETFQDLIEHKFDKWTNSADSAEDVSSSTDNSTPNLNGTANGSVSISRISPASSSTSSLKEDDSKPDKVELMEDFWINAMIRAQKKGLDLDSDIDPTIRKKTVFTTSGRGADDLPPIFVGSDNEGVMTSDNQSNPSFSTNVESNSETSQVESDEEKSDPSPIIEISPEIKIESEFQSQREEFVQDHQ